MSRSGERRLADLVLVLEARIAELEAQDEVHWKTRRTLLKERDEAQQALAERTRERDEAIASRYCPQHGGELDAIKQERTADRAAIRALVYMGEVYDTATIHWGDNCECFRCDTLRKHAAAIQRAQEATP